MPQMNKGGKFIFGKSIIRNNGIVQLPQQAIQEYNISSEGKVYLFTGSKSTGGFCVTRKGLLEPSKLGHILYDNPELKDYSASQGKFIKYKGHSYAWVEISPDGKIVLDNVKALQSVSRIKFYGMTVFCEVLCGEENKRILDNKLDKIPEYGIYKTLSGDAVRNVVDWMISEHYILKTKGKYPVLHSTYEELHYSESITEGKLKNLKKQLEVNKMPFDM